jgi:hypothetical protein
MMKAYHTDRDGIGIWRLSGVIRCDDARNLLRSLRESRGSGRGCFIIDFEKVDHVDYRAFRVLEDGCPTGMKVLLSGMNDYVLDIFAFAKRKDIISIYPDWKKAFRHLIVERGKIGASVVTDSVGNK